MNKKGSLSLSITAIVVIVIAFVVLGLGLSLTRTIFKGAQDKLPEAFAVTQLESEPTSENPITISQTVEITRNDEKTMSVGFYNKDTSTATGSTFAVTECLDKEKNLVLEENKPDMASISQDVAANTATGFSIILTEKGLAPGTFICTLAVCNMDDCTEPYDSKQFFLKVTS
ncbi:hypothetical protein GOV03_00470 [Candidatus Woesearchaeota archaeon]|nr:hypothetical protein [Candidatus Woesearchaeota archaeon]